MKDLTILQDTIEYVGEKHPDSLVFVRGDANALFNPRDNNKRDELFRYFMEENELLCVKFHHKTDHHFRGNGLSDPYIDVILHPKVTTAGLPTMVTESLTKVLCGNVNPLVDSTHDVLISSALIPLQPHDELTEDNVHAQRVQHTQHKVLWFE